MSPVPGAPSCETAVRRGRGGAGARGGRVTPWKRNELSPELKGMTKDPAFMAFFAGHPPTVYTFNATCLCNAGLNKRPQKI